MEDLVKRKSNNDGKRRNGSSAQVTIDEENKMVQDSSPNKKRKIAGASTIHIESSARIKNRLAS